VLVLEHHRKRNSGRLDRAGWLMLRNPDGNPLASGKNAGCAGRLSLDCDELVRHQSGGLSSRHAQLISQEPVQALGL
jgi:hypothetical protein